MEALLEQSSEDRLDFLGVSDRVPVGLYGEDSAFDRGLEFAQESPTVGRKSMSAAILSSLGRSCTR